MTSCCIVPFCSTRSSGHRLPQDALTKKKWLIAIRRSNYMPTQYSRVCKKHFLESDYIKPLESMCENPKLRLRKDSVPSQFTWTKPVSKANVERAERARKRFLLKRSTEGRTCSTSEEIVLETEDVCVNEVIVECSNKDVGVQCELISDIQRSDVLPKTSNINNSVWRIETYESGSKNFELKFNTGFDTYDHFSLVFSILGPAVNHLIYYPSCTTSITSSLLTPRNEFFLTVIKLRRNTTNKELAFRFNISVASVSRIFITWINFLYCQFKEINIWIPNKIAEENMKFKGKKCTNTIIIDCTEFKIQKPRNQISQQVTYSTYKSSNTLKVLIGMSSVGAITFISDAYGGSISDRQLFEKSGLIDLLQKNDVVLADKGFQIQDLLAHKDVQVNTPEFLKRHSGQMEPQQLDRSKRISSERIHIERIIGLGKTYKILTTPFTSNLVPLASRVIFVCYMFVNLRSNIMEE